MKPGPPSSQRSSVQFLRSAQAGDDWAVKAVYERYTPLLKRWAHGRLPRWARDLVDTEELVHEVLTQTIHHLKAVRYPGAGAFQGYMRRALKNRLINEIKRARNRPIVDTFGDQFDQMPSPLEELVGKEAVERFERAFHQLGQKDQELIVARVEIGMTYAEVAEATGRPSEDAARMAVSRALARLIRQMSNDAKRRT